MYGYELENLDLRRSGIDTSWERGNKICITNTERRVLKMDFRNGKTYGDRSSPRDIIQESLRSCQYYPVSMNQCRNSELIDHIYVSKLHAPTVKKAQRTTQSPFIHPTPVLMFTFSCNVMFDIYGTDKSLSMTYLDSDEKGEA